MKRLLVPCLAVLALAACSPSETPETAHGSSAAPDPGIPTDRDGVMTTQWSVTRAEGMDAILLIGAAGGDVMQADIYPDEIAWVRENVSAEGLAAIDAIDQRLRQEIGVLTGPSMAYFFSANDVGSLEDVIASARDPRGRLMPALMTSPHWDEQQFASAERLMPTLLTAFEALQAAGFSDWYEDNFAAGVQAGIATNLAAVSPYDLISEQANLLGRELDPQIEILIANFSQPYGIRIMGQRFVAYQGWSPAIQLRVAAHEIFHPPFDPNDADLFAQLANLESDPWMISIVEDHDPQYGYRTFSGVINEGSTQALDQIVADRLGFAQDPGERWRNSDGGMHMFAAAAYHAMIEDGFAETGGVYSDWLKSALERGLLSPEETRRRAAEIVGQETVDQWGPHRSVE
ncbi:hypothetical protein V0U79_10880 [Hyphobacterium sp. HN65]|uniref:Uncharacterized protein n=1 Tax=Hyphobacterium lacteum TaxID=3116575 RepID=A0ABU7LSN3_9PROT|nr:hypothetical protein [Hyphobacterium sp. HN65]MEE2526875.1 hypothetical protein [Hyphobacterium sp. HN65]